MDLGYNQDLSLLLTWSESLKGHSCGNSSRRLGCHVDAKQFGIIPQEQYPAGALAAIYNRRNQGHGEGTLSEQR